jgi:hypothetical protein
VPNKIKELMIFLIQSLFKYKKIVVCQPKIIKKKLKIPLKKIKIKNKDAADYFIFLPYSTAFNYN